MSFILKTPRRKKAKGRPADRFHVATVERLLHGPEGVAHVDGRAVFIPRTVPGDMVKFRLVRDHKTWSEGETVELLHASDRRHTPPCHLFGRCGGCQWLHVDYDFQLASKEDAVVQALRRVGRLEVPEVLPIVRSPRPYHYRHRARLRGRVLSEGVVVLGFMAAKTKRVISHDDCWIYSPTIRKALMTAGRRLPASVRGATFLCHGAHGDDGTALVIETNDRNLVEPLAAALTDTALRMPLRWRILCDVGDCDVASAEPPTVGFTVPGPDGTTIPMRSTADGFFQANLEANAELVRTVVEWSAAAPGETVVDLYAGVGNFSVPLAAAGVRVTAVEVDPTAAALARTNGEAYGDRLIVLDGRVEDHLAALADTAPATVILDPPREGAREAIEGVIALKPGRVVYVSCDPATLARDCRILVDAGFELRRVRPFDLFPQTFHVETVAELVRRTAAPEA